MTILDFLFPKHCVNCKKVGNYLCQDCALHLKPFFPQVCPVCQRASFGGITHKKCYKNYAPEGLNVIWQYNQTVRNLIAKLKYKYISDLTKLISSLAAQNLKKYPKDKFTIVPIPLHWLRENERGFNHTEEVAKYLKSEMGWKFQNLLVKIRKTKPQVGLKGKERRENIRGVFSPISNPPINYSDNILLFDDVFTTGSTILEATRTLKKAGFKKIWCLTLAG